MVPLRAAGVLRDLLSLWCNAWDDLRSATTVADDCNALVRYVEAMVPLSSMEDLPLVCVDAGEVCLAWYSEAADRGKEDIAALGSLASIGDVAEVDVPMAVLPPGTGTFFAEMEMFAQLEFVNSRFDI